LPTGVVERRAVYHKVSPWISAASGGGIVLATGCVVVDGGEQKLAPGGCGGE
jgi:hypothetical protein